MAHYQSILITLSLSLLLVLPTQAATQSTDFQVLHPRWHKLSVITGYHWTHDHVLVPVDRWATRHPGLVNLAGSMSGYATSFAVMLK